MGPFKNIVNGLAYSGLVLDSQEITVQKNKDFMDSILTPHRCMIGSEKRRMLNLRQLRRIHFFTHLWDSKVFVILTQSYLGSILFTHLRTNLMPFTHTAHVITILTRFERQSSASCCSQEPVTKIIILIKTTRLINYRSTLHAP